MSNCRFSAKHLAGCDCSYLLALSKIIIALPARMNGMACEKLSAWVRIALIDILHRPPGSISYVQWLQWSKAVTADLDFIILTLPIRRDGIRGGSTTAGAQPAQERAAVHQVLRRAGEAAAVRDADGAPPDPHAGRRHGRGMRSRPINSIRFHVTDSRISSGVCFSYHHIVCCSRLGTNCSQKSLHALFDGKTWQAMRTLSSCRS